MVFPQSYKTSEYLLGTHVPDTVTKYFEQLPHLTLTTTQ